jgi:hypothetical protein
MMATPARGRSGFVPPQFLLNSGRTSRHSPDGARSTR